jgi:calcium-dependent protein kinase
VEVQAGAGTAVRETPRNSQQPSSQSRVDVWNNAGTAQTAQEAVNFGYPRTLQQRFEVSQPLGKGGNATVYLVECRITGKQYACKSLPKVLTDSSASALKKATHQAAIAREVEVLKRLRGNLNVACLEGVYEDATHVHLVMEYCKGGELVHRIGDRHYSERTVASFMRAVLRTLAQCHSNHVLHRDIKPGNFMLLDEGDRAPLKAIDFGLAVPFDPQGLPLRDLGLEGTPWYMAPEVLSSQVGPASDLWAAGVMAFQLTTGRFPFDDKRNPFNPSVSKIWQSILTDKLDFSKGYWAGVSDEAKDFVKQLLQRDPEQRPTAKQALQHPWLKGGTVSERTKGKPLSLSVVQRIQRFSSSSAFKRTILEHIAQDLLASRPIAPRSPGMTTPRSPFAGSPARSASAPISCPLGPQARPIVTAPTDSALQFLYKALELEDQEQVDRDKVSQGLQRLGYKLEPGEVDRLLDTIDVANTSTITKSQLAASQIDWRVLQQNHAEQWLASVRRVFEEFDKDGNGFISVEQIMDCLRAKLPPQEVEAAVQHAMQEADKREESMHEGIDFNSFLKMLRTNSTDSLDQYDDRMSFAGSYDRLQTLLDKSVRAGDLYVRSAHLDSVAEVA